MDKEDAKRSRAILYMILATLAFAIMAACAKAAKDLAPFGSIISVRSTITIVVAYIWIRVRGVALFGYNKKFLILRSLLGFTALSLFMYTVQYLPLSCASILQQTSVLFVPILSILILGEEVTKELLFLIFAAFIGVVMIIRPAMVGDMLPWATGLFAAFVSATAYIAIRSMSGKEDPLTVVFYFGSISFLGSVLFLEGLKIPYENFDSMALILGSGIAGTAGQILLTTSFLLAPASIVAPFNFFGVIFSTALGMYFWGETLDSITMIGMGIIMSVGILIQRGKFGRFKIAKEVYPPVIE